MFRRHSRQNEGITGTSEDHDLQTSAVPSGAARERSLSLAQERFSNLTDLNSRKERTDKFAFPM